MAALSSPSQAQELVNQKPEEFAQLLQVKPSVYFKIFFTF
jgi:hypothetical protein